jgi:hypothetical protein
VQQTKPVQVDPATTSIAESTALTSNTEPTLPTTKVGVDKPVPQPTSEPSDAAEDGGSGSDDDDDDDSAASTIDKVESSVKDFWDWFTGKVGNWWDKVKGPGGAKGEDAGESSPS